MLTESREETVHTNEGTPRWMGIAVVALAAVSLLGLGVGWSASNNAREAQQAAANDNKTLRQNLDVVSQRLAQTEAANAQIQGDLSAVTGRLKLTQDELDKSHKQTGAIKTDYSKKIAGLQDEVQNGLATKASTDDLKAVSTDVNGVKTDLDATKQGLLAANGIINEHGTLIAKTHDDIEQLRRLGQRDYIEFTISGKDKQRVGNVSVELHGVNAKRNQYTVELYVDDMKLEKKNRAVNEPIFFYTRGSRQAMELVVNQIGKDKITGYISAPKSLGTTQAASSTSGSN